MKNVEKTAKAGNTKAPALPDNGEESYPVARAVDQALLGGAAAQELASQYGATIKHVSGSYPLITFDSVRDKGKTLCVRYLGLEPAGDNEWDMVQVEVFSYPKLLETGSPEVAYAGKAQIHVADNLKKWAGNLDHPERKDKHGNVRPAEAPRAATADPEKFYMIAYNGKIRTASNREVHKFAVGELILKPSKK